MRAVAVILVEEDTRLAATLTRGLVEDGLEVRAFTVRGLDASDRIANDDVIVLDLDPMTATFGAVLTQLRTSAPFAPALALVYRDHDQTLLRALAAGADECLVKQVPYYADLLAQLRALLRWASNGRRREPIKRGTMSLTIDPPVVVVDHREFSISPSAHALLAVLLDQDGAPISRAELGRRAFADRVDPRDLIDLHVMNLQRHGLRLESTRGQEVRLVIP